MRFLAIEEANYTNIKIENLCTEYVGELWSLKKDVRKNYKNTPSIVKFYFVGATAILENFVNKLIIIYIELINDILRYNTELKIEMLSSYIVVREYEKVSLFNTIGNAKRREAIDKVTNIREISKLGQRELSSVSYKDIRKLLEIFGVEINKNHFLNTRYSPVFGQKKTYIDYLTLISDRRNAIAHGEWGAFITVDEFRHLTLIIEEIIYILQDTLVEHINRHVIES